MVLVHAFGGSNPSSPANEEQLPAGCFLFALKGFEKERGPMNRMVHGGREDDSFPVEEVCGTVGSAGALAT